MTHFLTSVFLSFTKLHNCDFSALVKCYCNLLFRLINCFSTNRSTDFNLLFLLWLSSKAFSLNVTPRKITFPISLPHWVVCPYLLQTQIRRISLTLCPGMSGSLPISPLMDSVIYLFCFKNQLFSLMHENISSVSPLITSEKVASFFTSFLVSQISFEVPFGLR